MGVDYFVERGCTLQQELGTDGFLRTMAHRRQAMIFDAVEIEGTDAQGRRRVGRPVLPADGLPVYTLRGDRVEREVQTAAGAGVLEARLRAAAGECSGCPANTTDAPFGCYGFVSYPVAEATEQWLLQRARFTGVAAAMATKVLAKLGVTGSFAAELRGRGRTFFESPQPLAYVWALSDGVELLLTSDVVMELLLFRLPENPGLMFPMAAALLGLVRPEAATPQALMDWASVPGAIVPHLVAPALDGVPEEQQPFVEYLQRAVAAARGSFTLVTDG